MRKGDYKYVFSEQRKQGTMGVWAEPFTTLRLQKISNVMQDPFERADITSNTFWDWQINHVGSMYGVMDDVFAFVTTFSGASATLRRASTRRISWKRRSTTTKPGRC